MYIESIQLKNFRNYESLELNFDKATNKVYCYMADGTPNQVGEVVYGITGNVKDIKLTAGWTGKKWADF